MQNNLTYKKKFNLETRKESPALPKEVKERDWESEEDLVAVDDSYQYIIKYNEEWAEVGDLWKISHETHESEQIRTNVKLDWEQIREQFVDKEKQMKQEKKIQKPQEWIYYNTDEAIYRVPIDGGRSEKLFYLGNNTQWEYIELKNPKQTGIYFCYDDGIYGGDLEGESLEQIVTGNIERVEVKEDKATGKKEEIPKELAGAISWYQATEASKDEKGNYYVYKYNGDQPGSIVKVGAEIEEIIWELEGWNNQIRVIKQ